MIPLLLFVAIAGKIILVSSPPCDPPLFFYLPCRYHLIYPCHDCLFASLISPCLSCYNRLLLVLINLSLCVSSSHFTDYFDSPCCNCWCTYPRLFTLSWSSSSHIFASSISLFLSLSQSSSPFPDSLPLVTIPLLLLVAIVGASLLVKFVLVFPWFWCLDKSLPRCLGGSLDWVSHIGERVIGARENLGESDCGEIVKTTSVMFGVYVPGIKLITSFWSQYRPN